MNKNKPRIRPAPGDPHDPVDRLDEIATWLDSRFVIPGTSVRFGLDALLGSMPGIGDTIGLAASLYIYRQAGALCA